MKHLDSISTNNTCYSCKQTGFFIETPCYNDYTTCPVCTSHVDYITCTLLDGQSD